MVLCFSLTNLELGGAQVFVVRLANYLAKKNNQPVYIYDHWPEYRNKNTLHHLHPLVKILSYSESRFERWFIWKINAFFRLVKPGSQYRYFLNKKRLQKRLARYNVSLVNSHMSYSDFVLSETTLPPGCKLVITLHGEYELSMKDPKNNPDKIRKALDKSSALIYTAEKNLKPLDVIGYKRDIKKQKINIGFDPALFSEKKITRAQLSLRDDEFVVGMVSRGIADKGWDTAIAAVQQYNRSAAKKITLLCIGNGTYLQQLVEDAADANIRLQQFEENYQDYFYCYPLFDIFIFPTRFEGESVPNVLIECLYWGVPIVASHHAEIPAMLRCGTEQEAGICVEAGTIPLVTAFTTALSTLVSDQALRLKLSSNSAAAFKAFSMEGVAACYEKFFNEVRS